jgi:hypothetical protein
MACSIWQLKHCATGIPTQQDLSQRDSAVWSLGPSETSAASGLPLQLRLDHIAQRVVWDEPTASKGLAGAYMLRVIPASYRPPVSGRFIQNAPKAIPCGLHSSC